MRYTDEQIEEVRDATDIVDVVSQYVALKKRGKSYIGLCPFHQEKTPSFNVNPIQGFYKCFGCGEGGNVFTFLMKMDNVSFPEAVRSLAEKAHIELPEMQSDDRSKEIESLYHVLKMASEFYRQCLHETRAGRKAWDYFSNRGFDREISDAFQVGYAPNLWDGLLQKAAHDEVDPALLFKAGLVLPRKDHSGYYDRFRGRLMFPILNASGRVVGFGGRILKEDGKSPKYINSPETPVYSKGHILYGMYQSRLGIRRADRVLLVEGYTDLMRMHQHGLDHVTATSGTALTSQQAQLIRRYTQNVILVFDGDSAGMAAALRGADVLIETGLSVRVAPLPGGDDPDTFLRGRGREAMEAILESARTVIEFHVDLAKSVKKFSTPGDKLKTARQVLDLTKKVSDPMQKQLMIKQIADITGIEEALLFKESSKPKTGLQKSGSARPEAIETSDKPATALPRAERGILRLMLKENTPWQRFLFQYIAPEAFRHPAYQKIVRLLFDGHQNEMRFGVQDVMNRFSEDPATIQALTDLLVEELGNEESQAQYGLDCVLNLRLAPIRQKLQHVRESNRERHVEEYRKFRDELNHERESITASWKKLVENS